MKFEDGAWYLCGAPHMEEMEPILLDPISPHGQGFYTIVTGDDGELALREGGDIPDVPLSKVLECGPNAGTMLAGMVPESPEPLPLKDASISSASEDQSGDGLEDQLEEDMSVIDSECTLPLWHFHNF